jgi:hypothetical protein
MVSHTIALWLTWEAAGGSSHGELQQAAAFQRVVTQFAEDFFGKWDSFFLWPEGMAGREGGKALPYLWVTFGCRERERDMHSGRYHGTTALANRSSAVVAWFYCMKNFPWMTCLRRHGAGAETLGCDRGGELAWMSASPHLAQRDQLPREYAMFLACLVSRGCLVLPLLKPTLNLPSVLSPLPQFAILKESGALPECTFLPPCPKVVSSPLMPSFHFPFARSPSSLLALKPLPASAPSLPSHCRRWCATLLLDLPLTHPNTFLQPNQPRPSDPSQL